MYRYAASVTGGVYTSGNQTIAGTKTFSSTISGSISGNAGTATWADTVDVNNGDNSAANYYAVWHSGDTLYSTNGIYFHPGNNYVYATDFIASSDERLKNRVGNLDNALDKVCSLDGFLYTWNDKAESLDKETVQVGVSAQQVQEVLPEAVNENDNGYLGVKYDKLVPLLIESIKELKAEIEELKDIKLTHWSYYESWDPYRNYLIAKEFCGLQESTDSNQGTFTNFAQNDQYLYALHTYLMYLKFGFGRATQDAGIEIRRGAMTREQGMNLVKIYDAYYPEEFIDFYLDYYQMFEKDFLEIIDKWANKDLFIKKNKGWELKEEII